MENEPDISSNVYPKWIFYPLTLVPIILFLPVLLPGKSLFWGITSIQIIPWHWAALKDIQQGILPLWNTLNGLGAPLAANYQSALFYPPTWLILIAGWIGGITWLAWAHGLVIVLHLIWAGWGMKSLVASLGPGPISQLVCGLAYGLCGYLVARGGFLTMVQATSWIPWILLAASKMASPFKQVPANKNNKFRSIIWLALAFTGQWLSGHAQLVWYTILFSCAWLFYGVIINSGAKHLIKIMLQTLTAGIIGFLISSIQLIPTIEYFLQSQRSGAIDIQTALSYSFWPWRFITFLVPDFFGNPGRGDYWGYANFWEDAVYFGILPFFFAIMFLFKNGKQVLPELKERTRPFRWFAIVSIGITTIMALGWFTPVFPWLFEHVPTFGLFNGPTRWMILTEICLILLAAFGIEEWVHHSVITKRQVNISLTITLAGLSGAVAAWSFLPETNRTFATSLLASGVILLIYLILGKFKPINGNLITWRLLIVGWFSIDLIWAGVFLNQAIESTLFKVANESNSNLKIYSGERYFWNSIQENDQRFKRFFQFKDIRPVEDTFKLPETMLPNINILSNLAMLNNFDPMVPARYSAFIKELGESPDNVMKRYLEIANVGKIASFSIFDNQNVIWESISTKPEVRLVPCAIITKNESESLSWIRTAAVKNQFDTNVAIESDKKEQQNCSSYNLPGDIALVKTNINKGLTIETREIPSNQWMVISRTWYPGWQAKVDGVQVDVYRANYLFMGLEVPVGTHKIELFYQPISFQIGLVLSICGILIVLLVGFFSRRSGEDQVEG